MDSVTFDHHAPELDETEIWEAYGDLRNRGVCHSDAHGGFWVVTSHDQAKPLLRDHASFSSAPSHRLPQRDVPAIVPIDFDPPVHTRYRDAMSEAIRPERLRALGGFIRTTVGEVLADFYERGAGDVRRGLAIVLPFRVLTGFLGFSRETVDALLAASDRPAAHPDTDEGHHSADPGIRALIEAEIDRHRRGEGRGDYVDWLLEEQVDKGLVTADEAVEILLTFAVSGHKTTMNSTSSLFYLLGRDPSLQAALREDPTLAPAYVEEMLRLRTPAQNLARRTTCPVRVGDVEIAAGERVVVSIAAANRDEAKYAAPDVFDASRPTRGHLAFGWGIHQCLGAPLARAELKALLEALVEYPTFSLAGEVSFSAVHEGLHLGPSFLGICFDEPGQPGR